MREFAKGIFPRRRWEFPVELTALRIGLRCGVPREEEPKRKTRARNVKYAWLDSADHAASEPPEST